MEQPPQLLTDFLSLLPSHGADWLRLLAVGMPDWWWAGEHKHAHLTFIEISFGLNTVFALYEELRQYIRRGTEAEINSIRGALTAIIADIPHDLMRVQVVSRTRRLVDAQVNESDVWQTRLTAISTRIAIGCAVLAATILYADWVEHVSWACIVLILPLPAYWLLSHVNYRGCLSKCQRHFGRSQELIHDFLDPELPGDPPSAGR